LVVFYQHVVLKNETGSASGPVLFTSRKMVYMWKVTEGLL